MIKKFNIYFIFILLFLTINISFAHAANQTQNNLIKCSSVAYVIQFGFPDNKQVGEMLTKTQFFYDDLYRIVSDKKMTNAEFSEMKSNAIISLGDIYDKNINSLYELEYNCNQWRIQILEAGKIILSKPEKIPDFPKKIILDEERFKLGKVMIDESFKNWSDPTLNRLEMKRPTPKKISQLMSELLNKKN